MRNKIVEGRQWDISKQKAVEGHRGKSKASAGFEIYTEKKNLPKIYSKKRNNTTKQELTLSIL